MLPLPPTPCPQYDLEAEATIAGLNIVGKLYVPPNYKSTLHTSYVVVQGELQMEDTNPVSEDNTSMKIVLTGTTDVNWTPEEPVDGMTTLNLGVKPFLVAGGKLDIRGWNDGDDTTWTPLLDVTTADRVYPAPIFDPVGERTVALPPPTQCPAQIVNFPENGFDGTVWSGGGGGILEYNETSKTLSETNLNHNWQGFNLELTKFIKDCPLIADATYLVTIRLKIDDPALAEGAVTSCETSKLNCPKLGRWMSYSSKNDAYKSMSVSHLVSSSGQCYSIILLPLKRHPFSFLFFFSHHFFLAGISTSYWS